MSFHLVAIGGTGLWAMYHHFLKHAAQVQAGVTPVSLPSRVTVIDQAGDDVAAILEQLHQLKAGSQFHAKFPTPGRIRLGDAASPHGSLVTDLASSRKVGDPIPLATAESALAHACLAYQTEIKRNTNIGFFGQPRLTAWWVKLFDFHIESLPADGTPSPWIDALRSNNLAAREGARTAEGETVILVGSIVGGTGAGLMPTLAAELSGERSSARPSAWQTAFHAVTLLPWFSPSAIRKTEGAPSPERLQANAGRGAQAMLDVFERLQAKIDGNRALGEAAVNPRVKTSLSLIGSPEQLLEAQLPLRPSVDAADARQRLSVAPIFDVVSAAIEAALQNQDATLQHREHPRVQFFALGATRPGEHPLTVWTPAKEGQVTAAQRAKLLAQESHFPLLGASRFLPILPAGIQRPDGLGKTLSAVLAGATQAGAGRAKQFLTAFRAELERNAEDTFAEYGRLPADGETTLSQALETSVVIAAMDEVFSNASSVHSELFSVADTGRNAALSQQDLEQKGRSAAAKVWSILLGAAARQDPRTLQLSNPSDATQFVSWLPQGQLSQTVAPSPLASGEPGRLYSYRVADPSHLGILRQTIGGIRTTLARGLTYDTEGWAECFGHYQAVLADLDRGSNLGALQDQTWEPFKSAARSLYLGVALGRLDIQPLTPEERTLAGIGAGQRTLDDQFPAKIVVRDAPSFIAGFVLPDLGLCPSDRAVRAEAADPLTQHLTTILSDADAVGEASGMLGWYAQQLPQEERARLLLDLLFPRASTEMPRFASGIPRYIPGAAFSLRGSRHFLPRARRESEVAALARITAVPVQNPSIESCFERPFGNDAFLKHGFPAHLQAYCNGLPQAPAQSPKPLLHHFFRVA
jgi:hypothetical protein